MLKIEIFFLSQKCWESFRRMLMFYKLLCREVTEAIFLQRSLRVETHRALSLASTRSPLGTHPHTLRNMPGKQFIHN